MSPSYKIAFLVGTSSETRCLAACTQAVIILRHTSHIAIKLDILFLKDYHLTRLQELTRYLLQFLKTVYPAR